MGTSRHAQRGFIALVSSLVISAILVTLVFSVGTSALFARFDALNGENKRISLGLAESCVNVALIALATSTSPSTYSPTNMVVTIGADSRGNDMTCTIQSITHSGQVVTIDTQAQWLGAYSNVTARATIPDPSAGVLVPPPTCALSASPVMVPQGQSVLLQWGTANASSFSLDHGLGNQTSLASGSVSVTATSTGSVTYIGTATGPGGSAQCSATFSVSSPPQTPGCADTVMIFNRTTDMNPTDRANQNAAGTQLINLYASVSALPRVGVGSFGGLTSGMWAEIPGAPPGISPTGGKLSFNYASLISTLNSIMGGTSSGGSDLGQGIEVARQELDSMRSTKLQKAIVFVSGGDADHASPSGNCPMTDPAESFICRADDARDHFGPDANGKPTLQIFTVYYSHVVNTAARELLAQVANDSADDSNVTSSTGVAYPTRAIGTLPNNKWTNSPNAFSNDTAFATNSVANDAQAYGDFNLSVPSGATVTNIDVVVDGYAGAEAVNGPHVAPNGTGTYDGWTQTGGSSKANAVAVNDGDVSRISVSSPTGTAQTFTFPNPVIPAGATINSVTVTAVASRTSTVTTQFALRAEIGNGAGQQSDGATITIGTAANTYATYSRPPMTTNPFTGDAWTQSDIAAMRFGVIKINSTGTVRVTQMYITVNYTPATTVSSCQLYTDLSWNNGVSWSTPRAITLNTIESAISIGGDTWGRSWSNAQFSNGNFLLRLTNDTCHGTVAASVNYMTVSVTYTALNPSMENSDGDNFFITSDTSNASSLQDIFDTIGHKVCPASAAQCANTVDDDSDGLIDIADPQCHIDGVASNSFSYDPTISDEYLHPAPPPPPVAPPPPPSVDLGSWEQVVQ